MGLVVFEVTYVRLKLICLQDAKAVSLVGCVYKALKNAVNEMCADYFIVMIDSFG
jgi:hypothetical protein